MDNWKKGLDVWSKTKCFFVDWLASQSHAVEPWPVCHTTTFWQHHRFLRFEVPGPGTCTAEEDKSMSNQDVPRPQVQRPRPHHSHTSDIVIRRHSAPFLGLTNTQPTGPDTSFDIFSLIHFPRALLFTILFTAYIAFLHFPDTGYNVLGVKY